MNDCGKSAKLRVGRREILLSLTGLALAGGAATALGQVWRPPAATSLQAPPQPRSIAVTARALPAFEREAPDRREFGRLSYRGGLVLESADRDFGGWSGLIVDDAGRQVLMVSDAGSWLIGRLGYDGRRPGSLADAVLGPILGPERRELDRKTERDAESVVLLDGSLSQGKVLISFERRHRIERFPITARGLGPPEAALVLPRAARRMRPNKGLEAICVLRQGPLRGAVVAFAEELYDHARNHTGWIWADGPEHKPLQLGLVNRNDFAVTELAVLDTGDLLVLERRFRVMEGVRMRLRLIEGDAIRPGALLDGEVLLEADLGYEIDNMEALAVHRDQAGDTVLTVISDNNFNPFLQRTLLLQFALEDATRRSRKSPG